MFVKMELIEKIKTYKGTIVLRDFDNSYKIFFWFVPMTREEFESWWMNQETFDDNPPGKNEIMEILKKSCNEPYEPKPVWVFEWPGEIINTETDEMSELWLKLDESKKYHFCHIYSDEDSFLITPEGKYLYHKGYCGEKKDYRGK
jgi:hypothetical protein